MLSPPVAELAPTARVSLNTEDAAALGLKDNEAVTITQGGTTLKLPVQVLRGLPRGLAGVPVGLPGVPVVSLPAWARLEKEHTSQGAL